MPMEKQTVGIPLLGLNTVADPKSAAAGEFDLVENMFFNRTARGGAELKKRNGGAALSRTGNSGAFVSGKRLATFKNERLMIGSTQFIADPVSIASYDQHLGTWRTLYGVNVGQSAVPSVGVDLSVVSANTKNFRDPDIAVSPDGSVMCMAFVDTGLSNLPTFASFDVATGKLLNVVGILSGVTSAGWVRVIALSDRFLFLASSLVAGRISAITLLYSNPINGLSGTVNVIADLNASCKADVIKNGSNDSVLLAYHSTVPDVRCVSIDSTMAVSAATTTAEATCQAIGWLSWSFSDGNGYLAFVSTTTGAKLFTVAQAGPTFGATTTMDASVTSAANVTGYKNTTAPARTHVYIEVRAAATFNTLLRLWPGSGTAASVIQRSVGIASACFTVPGTSRYYLPVVYDSTLQGSYALLDVTNSDVSDNRLIIGRFLYGLGGGQSFAGSLGASAALTTTTMAMPVLKLTQSQSGVKLFAPGILRIDFAALSISPGKVIGDNLHLSGGATKVYDGISSTELGFNVFPEVPTPVAGAGGALTLLGSYQYCAVYAWFDNKGQLHRSAPSTGATVILTGANQSVSVTVPTLRLSNKDDLILNIRNRVFIEVYRTVASGTTFFHIGSVDNNQAVDTVAYADLASDAAISAFEILYTNGKVLPHIGPPSARLMESWRNRLFLAGTENPNELWVSNEYSPGLGGVTFSDALVMSIESEGGPITALCEMDDRLLIFKRNAIYVLTGNGPTLTGDNQFQQPQRINFTIGAVEQRGVIKTRDGVMFKSTRGIFLLTHAGQPVYAGAGVDIYNSLTVTGSMLLEDEEQVRFVTAEGRTLVYHYGLPGEDGIGKWTTFTNQAAVDCIVWNGKAVHLRSDGTVVEETVGTYVDPSATSINAKVRLAWLSLTQFFGRFRLYGLSLLGDIMATFTLTHRIAYDYDATVAETETKAVTVATLPPLELSPARRRCTAVQVTLEETSTTQGFTVSSWGLEVGTEPGAIKTGTDKFLT